MNGAPCSSWARGSSNRNFARGHRRCDPRCRLCGFLDQSQIARAYVAADIFALVSSHDETWGLVVNEAMNFGLPIIVSDRVGSASDLVKDGHNGFVVPHDDLDALIARYRLVVSDDLRTRFGEASRQMISRGRTTYRRRGW